MTFRPMVRVRAQADFILAGEIVREGTALIVEQSEARRLVAAGLCRLATANGAQPCDRNRWTTPLTR